jgi:hypothetical protein
MSTRPNPPSLLRVANAIIAMDGGRGGLLWPRALGVWTSHVCVPTDSLMPRTLDYRDNSPLTSSNAAVTNGRDPQRYVADPRSQYWSSSRPRRRPWLARPQETGIVTCLRVPLRPRPRP